MIESEEERTEVLVELLREVLGHEKQHYDSKGQISFDCPVCASEKGVEGDGKGNLEINYFRGVYKCWACAETYGTQGVLEVRQVLKILQILKLLQVLKELKVLMVLIVLNELQVLEVLQVLQVL